MKQIIYLVQSIEKRRMLSLLCPKCNAQSSVIATLRTRYNKPIKNRVSCKCTKTAFEYDLSENESYEILKHEKALPTINIHVLLLLKNGRISAFDGMTTDDLFTTRALHCHAYLFDKINAIKDFNVQNLFKFAFTSNLANC